MLGNRENPINFPLPDLFYLATFATIQKKNNKPLANWEFYNFSAPITQVFSYSKHALNVYIHIIMQQKEIKLPSPNWNNNSTCKLPIFHTTQNSNAAT